MPLTRLLHRIVHLRIGARQLAVARILIGVNAMFASLEAMRALQRVLPPMIVKIPFIASLPVMPSRALPAYIAGSILAALLFVLGWKTRFAGAVLALSTGYTLIVDQQAFSNHLYLLFLAVLLLTIADSGAAWSLDARRRGTRAQVAAWPALLLRFQVTVVYVFSALAKITPQYLAGEILLRSLKQGGLLAVPQSWRTPGFVISLAVASIFLELFIACGLWSRRLRPYAIVAGIGFHTLILVMIDSSRLSLAIFALTMFAAYVLFVDEKSWHRWKSIKKSSADPRADARRETPVEG